MLIRIGNPSIIFMIDILFSHSYYYQLDPKQWEIKNPFPPLGTIYAASFMREDGFKVELFDTNLLDGPLAIEEKIKVSKPSFLVLFDDGFNYLTKMCLTNMREAAFQMISIGKQNNCQVIVCSSDSSDHSGQYLDAGADYIIKGEGEITLKELIESINTNKDIDNVKGVVYRKNNQIQDTGKRNVVVDLDVFPMPAWDLIDIEAYKEVWKESGKEFTLNLATTRGCPYKCNWCAKPIYGNRYNSHSPGFIVNEIAYLNKNFGVSRFWMCDDIFGLKPNWVTSFKTQLEDERLSIKYYIQSRVDLLLKENTIETLVASGLEEVWIGAESGSQKILDAMDKGTTVNQIYQATKLLKDKKVSVAFFIQYGYLGETKKDIAATIKMIKELMPDNLGISVSYPLPGTAFYDKVKQDLQVKTNWEDSNDLAMMFKGTFNSNFYRKLYRHTHKEYRKSQGLYALKEIVKSPLSLNAKKIRAVLLYFYYLPSTLIERKQLKKMQHTS